MKRIKKLRKDNHSDSISIKGFLRVTMDKGGEIVGDSGWIQNLCTNVGLEKFAAYTLGASAGSLQLGFAALGSGGAPATNDTALTGEVMGDSKRVSFSAKSFSSRTTSTGKCTLFLYGQFASTDSFLSDSNSYDINNIGLFNSISGGTLFCGTTYSSSNLDTNQNVNFTYQLQIG